MWPLDLSAQCLRPTAVQAGQQLRARQLRASELRSNVVPARDRRWGDLRTAKLKSGQIMDDRNAGQLFTTSNTVICRREDDLLEIANLAEGWRCTATGALRRARPAYAECRQPLRAPT